MSIQGLEIAKFKIVGTSNFSYVDKSVKVPTLARTLYKGRTMNYPDAGQEYEPNVKFAEGAFQLQFMNLSVQECGQEVSNSFLERYQGKDFRRFFCQSDPKRAAPASLTFCLDLKVLFFGNGKFGDGQNFIVPITVGLEPLSKGYAWWIGSDQLVWSTNKNLVQFKANQTVPVNDCWLICRDGSSSAPRIIFRLDPALYSGTYDKGLFQFECLAPQLKYHARWQSQLSDERLITDVSLPGTHDSAAISKTTTPSACQTLSITQQLIAGIRLFDIRIKVQKKSGSFYFATCHGGDKLEFFYSDLTTYQSLESVLTEFKLFLKEYPREFIVMMMQIEGWSIAIDGWSDVKPGDKAALDALWALVSKFNIYPIVSIPRVSDIRGKICILNHLDKSRPIVYSDSRFGRVLGWDEKSARYSEVFPDTYDKTDLSLQITTNQKRIILQNAIGLLVQDYFQYNLTDTISLSTAVNDKFNKYIDIVNDPKVSILLSDSRQSIELDIARRIIINFGSAFLLELNQDVNIRKTLIQRLGQVKGSNRSKTFGWSFFNYTDQEYETDKYSHMSIIDLIVDANFSYSRFPDTFKLM